MNKKVLVLSSSPRRGGNSDLLCDQFISGASEAGHQVEKIFLKDRNINYCTGCGTCFNGNKPCPQKDDMKEILEKIVEADVIASDTRLFLYNVRANEDTD
jgi:multimeric flavodoxin WrbA